MQVDQMHLKEKKDRQNAKKAESNTEPVPDADSDSLEPHKLGGDGPNSSLSAQQVQQNIFELDETRKIMIKRRKPMPLIEEYNFDELLTEDQRDCILKGKRRRLDSIQNGSQKEFSTNDSNFNSSDHGEQACAPLKEEERSILK